MQLRPLHCAIALLIASSLVPAHSGPPAAQALPAADEVARTRAAYEAELAAIARSIVEAIDKQKELINPSLSVDVIRAQRDEIAAKRRAFETSGVIPAKVYVGDLDRRRSAAILSLTQLYERLEKPLVLADRDDEADALRADRVALLAVEDLAPWRPADPFFEHFEEIRRWTNFERSYSSPGTDPEKKQATIPFRLGAELDADPLQYSIRFELERLEEPGTGLDLEFRDWQHRIVHHRVTAAELDAALRSKVFGPEKLAHFVLTVQDRYLRLDAEGVTILRRVTGQDSAEDAAARGDDPWISIAPERGARIRVRDVDWKPLRQRVAKDEEVGQILQAKPRSSSEPQKSEPTPAPKTTEPAPRSARAKPRPIRTRSASVERSIRDGLCWLARHQNDDGSWSPTTVAARCASQSTIYVPKKEYKATYDVGVTALAVLAFLERAGRTDDQLIDAQSGKTWSARSAAEKGLRSLVASQRPDGSFSKDSVFMYCEALATQALCEGFAVLGDDSLAMPAQKGLEYVEAAQRPSPSGQGLWGWRYAARQEVERAHAGDANVSEVKELYDADTSVTSRCTAALRAGIAAGLVVKDEHLRGAQAFAEFVTQIGGDELPTGLVGYLDAKGAGASVTGPYDQYTYHPAVMSALAVHVRRDAGAGTKDPFFAAATKRLLMDLPVLSEDRLSVDYYYWHNATRALSALSGPAAGKRDASVWSPWNTAVTAALITLQDATKKSCTHGGWLVEDRWTYDHGGPVYATAINVLTLQACD